LVLELVIIGINYRGNVLERSLKSWVLLIDFINFFQAWLASRFKVIEYWII